MSCDGFRRHGNSSPLVRGSEAIVDEAGVVWDGDGIAPHGKQMRQDENPQLMRGKVPQTLRGVTTGVDWVDSRLFGAANRGASSPLPGAHEDKTAGPSVAPVPPWTGRDEDETAGAGVYIILRVSVMLGYAENTCLHCRRNSGSLPSVPSKKPGSGTCGSAGLQAGEESL